MKKTLYIAMALMFCAISASSSFAADEETGGDGGAATGITQDGSGGTVTIPAGSVDGAQPIEFNPSTNVNIVGTSTATDFGIAGWHTQALKKAAGQAYAMIADSNKMYFMDISGDGATAPAAADVPITFDAIEADTDWISM